MQNFNDPLSKNYAIIRWQFIHKDRTLEKHVRKSKKEEEIVESAA